MPGYGDSDSSSSSTRSMGHSSSSPERVRSRRSSSSSSSRDYRRRRNRKRQRSSSYSEERRRRRSRDSSNTRRRSRLSRSGERSHKKDVIKRSLINVNISMLNQKFTRSARRLFVGNLPVGPSYTEAFFKHYFDTKIVPKYGFKGIISFWHGGAYGFAEFLSVRDTTRAKTELDGMILGGQRLRCRRPTDYTPLPYYLRDYVVGEPNPPMPEDFDLSEYPHIFGVQQPAPPSKPVKIKEMPLPGRGDLKKQLQKIRSAGGGEKVDISLSKVLRIGDMITDKMIASNKTLKTALRMIRNFLSSVGEIESLIIPREGELQNDLGVGNVYVQFASNVDKSKIKKEFDNRKLTVEDFDESKFALMELD